MVQKPKDAMAGMPLDQPDFASLLEAIGKRKDTQAFIGLYEYFAPRIKSFLIKGGADAETADELTQETMLTIWNKAETYDRRMAAPSTWIFRIARNKRIDGLRRGGGQKFSDVSEVEIEEPSANALEAMGADEEADILSRALETLPEEQSDLLRKSFFEEKSHAQIAEETGLPLGTVKSRIRLALERLRGQRKVKALWS